MSPTERLILVRAKLARRQLPSPAARRAWYSDGVGLRCDGCEEVITRTEIQVQVIFVGTVPLRLHTGCFVCWRGAVEGVDRRDRRE